VRKQWLILYKLCASKTPTVRLSYLECRVLFELNDSYIILKDTARVVLDLLCMPSLRWEKIDMTSWCSRREIHESAMSSACLCVRRARGSLRRLEPVALDNVWHLKFAISGSYELQFRYLLCILLCIK
jgi:hypothetical protein